MKLARFLALAAALGLGVSWFAAAADEDDKALKEALLKLAVAVEKNDKEAAKKLVDEIRKKDLEDIMYLMRAPSKTGVDVGFKEGIETKLTNASKKAGDAKTSAAAYEKTASVLAAFAEVVAGKCPVPQKMGGKDPKDWAKWVEELKAGAKALDEAAKAKDAKKLSTAAKKIYGTCQECHGVFKEN
jgi:hypothetical protein